MKSPGEGGGEEVQSEKRTEREREAGDESGFIPAWAPPLPPHTVPIPSLLLVLITQNPFYLPEAIKHPFPCFFMCK